MIAWLAAQFAQPAIKWGAIAGAIVLALGGLWTHGYVKGKSVVKQAWDASIAEQAAQSTREVLAGNELTRQVLAHHAEAEQHVRDWQQFIQTKVVQHVQATTQPCAVDPALVELLDAISRVPDDPERVPATDGGTGESALASEAGITTNELLQAYAKAAEELAWLWVDYAGLVEFERGRYIVQKAVFDHE